MPQTQMRESFPKVWVSKPHLIAYLILALVGVAGAVLLYWIARPCIPWYLVGYTLAVAAVLVIDRILRYREPSGWDHFRLKNETERGVAKVVVKGKCEDGSEAEIAERNFATADDPNACLPPHAVGIVLHETPPCVPSELSFTVTFDGGTSCTVTVPIQMEQLPEGECEVIVIEEPLLVDPGVIDDPLANRRGGILVQVICPGMDPPEMMGSCQ